MSWVLRVGVLYGMGVEGGWVSMVGVWVGCWSWAVVLYGVGVAGGCCGCIRCAALTWVGPVSHQQEPQRRQIDVLVVLLGQQAPVHVARLHHRHRRCNRATIRTLSRLRKSTAFRGCSTQERKAVFSGGKHNNYRTTASAGERPSETRANVATWCDIYATRHLRVRYVPYST